MVGIVVKVVGGNGMVVPMDAVHALRTVMTDRDDIAKKRCQQAQRVIEGRNAVITVRPATVHPLANR